MILGLAGRAGSGKTTIAKEIKRQKSRYCIISFASPIKSMVKALLNEMGTVNTKELLGTQKGKSTKIELLGWRTIRYLLQTIGTEWGREMVHGDMWIDIAIAKAAAFRDAGYSVVIDDVRFDNEAASIEKVGGHIVCIERPKGDRVCSDEHASESSFTAKTRYKYFMNDGELESVRGKVSGFNWN